MDEFNTPANSFRPEGETVTPYQRAQQEWDERIGAARVQAANWRLMALSLVFVVLALIGGLIFLATRSSLVPYVVEVGGDGLVRSVGPATRTNYTPNRQVIQYFLGQFVKQVRSLPADPVVAKNQWLTAYAYLRRGAANTMNEIVLREKPLDKVGEQMVSVQIRSIVPLSPESYQVRWEESMYNKDGAGLGSQKMTGLFTLEIVPPTDEKALQVNPLGLYIKRFSWSQDF